MITGCHEKHWSREQKEYLEIKIMTRLSHKIEAVEDKVEETSRKKSKKQEEMESMGEK